MRSATSIALLAVAAALIVFVLVYEKDRAGTRERSDLPPISFDPAEARLISISKGGENFTLSNEAGRWLVSLPFEDRANQELCEELLDALNRASILETIDSFELTDGTISIDEIDLAPKGGIKITIFGGEGALASIRIGRRGALENTAYAAFPGSKRLRDVYILDSDLAGLAARLLAGLRDTRLFPMSLTEVGRVVLDDGQGKLIELFRDPRTTLWQLARPLAARADQERVDGLVREICALEIEAFLENGAVAQAADPVSGPSVSLWPVPAGFAAVLPLPEVGRGPEERVRLEIAAAEPASDAPGAGIAARISGRGVAFRVPARVAALFDTDPEALRDPFLAQVPDRSIRGIVISSPGATDVMLSSNGRAWMSLRNGEWETADSSAVERFLEALNEEKVLDHIVPEGPRPLQAYGLDPPTVRIGLTTSSVGAVPGVESGPPRTGPGETLLEPESLSYVLGLGLVPGDKGADGPRLYAKFANEPDVLAIDPSFLARVPDHPLKWKSRAVLAFNIVSLREISVRSGGPEATPTRLAYDLAANAWSLFAGDENLTPRLDARKARALADALGSLRARDWLSSREGALRALESPALVVDIRLNNLSDDGSREIEEIQTLRFAPVAASGPSEGLHYGSLDGSPEAFLVDGPVVEAIRAPLTKSQ